MSPPLLSSLVALRPYVGGHLCLQYLLHRPLHYSPQKLRVIQQHSLCDRVLKLLSLRLAIRSLLRWLFVVTHLSWTNDGLLSTQLPFLQNIQDVIRRRDLL